MKAKIISVIIVLIILLGGISGYFLYQRHIEDKIISEKTNEMNAIKDKFDSSTNRDSKLEVLKSTIQASNDYNESKKVFPEISDKYEALIMSMQKEFIGEYDNVIKENTIDNLNSVEDTDAINASTENLNILLTTIESEKEYTLSSDSEYNEYAKKISALTETYSTQIVAIEEKRKAEEEAKKQAEEEARKKAEEEKAKTHYENEYFSVDVPAEWAGDWSVTEEVRGTDGVIYSFNYFPQIENYGGIANVFVVDATYGLPQNGAVIDRPCELVGYTSNKFGIFKEEVSAGFFFDGGATITLK